MCITINSCLAKLGASVYFNRKQACLYLKYPYVLFLKKFYYHGVNIFYILKQSSIYRLHSYKLVVSFASL